MFDSLFEFETEKMPLPVLLSTVGLILLFTLGLLYRLIVYVAF